MERMERNGMRQHFFFVRHFVVDTFLFVADYSTHYTLQLALNAQCWLQR